MPARGLQALLWDVDGTLAETEDDGHRVAFNLAFEEAGLPWHWDRALYGELLQVTGGKERLRAWWSRADAPSADSVHAAAMIRQLHAAKTAHYLRLLASGAVGLRPGVHRLLDQASAAGLRQAIATTTTADNVLGLLDARLGPTGRGCFEVIGAGDIVARKKPAPDIYEWVLDKLRLPARSCLAIEDSPAGVQAALQAGVPVVLVRARYTPPGEMPGVLADLDSLGLEAEPARGSAMGQPWQGVVEVTTLQRWWQEAG